MPLSEGSWFLLVKCFFIKSLARDESVAFLNCGPVGRNSIMYIFFKMMLSQHFQIYFLLIFGLSLHFLCNSLYYNVLYSEGLVCKPSLSLHYLSSACMASQEEQRKVFPKCFHAWNFHQKARCNRKEAPYDRKEAPCERKEALYDCYRHPYFH